VLPLVGFVPLQPPEAVQEVAPLEAQDSVVAPPEEIADGLAVRVTATACGVTVTVALALADPSEPVQVNVKLVVAFSGPVELEPFVSFEPLHPPEAAHAVAFVEFQLSVALPPAEMLVGDALKDTVGGVLDALLPPPQAARVRNTATMPAAKTRSKSACAKLRACGGTMERFAVCDLILHG
jgi:hypothetical protein